MRERVADGRIHAVGIAASLVALAVLLVIGVKSQMSLWVVSLAIYGLALVAMFSCSAGYNLIMHPPKLKEVFRRLDHAAIFLKIAATYTPFADQDGELPGFGLLAWCGRRGARPLIKLVCPALSRRRRLSGFIWRRGGRSSRCIRF